MRHIVHAACLGQLLKAGSIGHAISMLDVQLPGHSFHVHHLRDAPLRSGRDSLGMFGKRMFVEALPKKTDQNSQVHFRGFCILGH